MTAKMEVDVEKCGVSVGPASAGSVTVSLHPLVIMNISEHWTRVTAQEGKPTPGTVVTLWLFPSKLCVQIYGESFG